MDSWRALDGGMDNDSRYLATVRLAIRMSLARSMVAMLLSDNGFEGSSSSVNLRMSALIARLEISFPCMV